MIDVQLAEKSRILNISVDDLIDRYIRRGLFCDDYYEPPKLTRKEVIEIFRKDVEKDIKRGIIPTQKRDFSVFINRWSNCDD